MKFTKYLIACGLAIGVATPLGLSLAKQETKEVKAVTKDLSTIITPGTTSFTLNAICDFFFDFDLSEQIFTRQSYVNDWLNSFLDENDQPINLGDGIIINDHTLKYWVDFTADDFSYPRNEGVHLFPLAAGSKFAPVALDIKANALAFKVNLNYFPMDSITVTFKAGLFKGYYNGTSFTLSEDLTFYASLYSTNPEIVKFTRTPNEKIINPKITSADDWGEKTSEKGGKYHRYLIRTNIPRDKAKFNQTFSADHHRFYFDNWEINGRPLTYYNAWARGNSKDFTDLSDNSTQNPDYETGHPGGDKSPKQCLALYTETPMDQDNYVAFINVPNQLVTDLNLGSLQFSLRDGSAWWTLDNDGNTMIGRYDSVAFNNLVTAAGDELDNYPDLSSYGEAEQEEILNIISAAKSEMEEAFSEDDIPTIVAATKEAIDNVKSPEQKIAEEHIAIVVALIDAIPEEITYTEECGNAIHVALEAFATLTDYEVSLFPTEKLNKLYEAASAFNDLDLQNYKTLAIEYIASLVNLEDYREIERAAVEDLLVPALANIINAQSKSEIDTVVAALLAAINEIPTDAVLSVRELNAAKVDAKAQLDTIDLSLYRDEQRAEVEELVTKGKVAIDNCQTVEEVNTLLERILTVISSIKTNDQLNADEASANRMMQQRVTYTVIISVASLVIISSLVATSIYFLKKKKNSL